MGKKDKWDKKVTPTLSQTTQQRTTEYWMKHNIDGDIIPYDVIMNGYTPSAR